MKLSSLGDLLVDQLKDLHSAESQLVKALPKMAKGASSEALREAIEHHLRETKAQLQRLQSIGETLGQKLSGKSCKAMEGLIEEGSEILEAEGDDAVRDAGIIAAAQRVEHYEISAYGSARAIAEQLGHNEIVEMLQQTLEEESAADEKLTEISESEILPHSAMDAGEEDEEEEVMPTRSHSKNRSRSKARQH
jgi:ferritin-like metal-binding protein YciE